MLCSEVLFSGLLPTDVRLPPELPLPDSLRLEALLPLDTTAQAVSLAFRTSPGSPLAPAVLVEINDVERGTGGKGRLRLNLLPLVMVRLRVDV